MEIHGQRLGALRAGAECALDTLAQVRAALPAELAEHVHGASFEPDGRLTLLAESGAFATRLRYALPEVLPRVRDAEGKPAVRGRVQVRPKAQIRG